MAYISLRNVTLDYPIYGSVRSLRKVLFSGLGGITGGRIEREGRGDRVVVRALKNLNIEIGHGDRVGLIGHNGAGKSTLLRVLAGVFTPTSGDIVVDGTVSPLFSSAPGLDPDDTGYENLINCGVFLGLTRAQIAERTPEIVAVSGLGEYMDLPVRTYSAGMVTRLGFALATSIDPDILLLDEGLAAGDARFAEEAARRIESLVARSNILVFASHAEALIEMMCNRALLLEHGQIVADGPVADILKEYHAKIHHAEAANGEHESADGVAPPEPAVK